jgi:hypothetical protein
MSDQEAIDTLTARGFQVAVNEHGRWVAVKGQRRVFGDDPVQILYTVQADYRPGKDS